MRSSLGTEFYEKMIHPFAHWSRINLPTVGSDAATALNLTIIRPTTAVARPRRSAVSSLCTRDLETFASSRERTRAPPCGARRFEHIPLSEIATSAVSRESPAVGHVKITRNKIACQDEYTREKPPYLSVVTTRTAVRRFIEKPDGNAPNFPPRIS